MEPRVCGGLVVTLVCAIDQVEPVCSNIPMNGERALVHILTGYLGSGKTTLPGEVFTLFRRPLRRGTAGAG